MGNNVMNFGKDQSGLSMGAKRKATNLVRSKALKDVTGGRGKHPNSIAALHRHRPTVPPVTMGPRCQGLNRERKPCGKPALNGAHHCENHGGRFEAPTNPATVAWYRRHGFTIDQRRAAIASNISEAQSYVREERSTVEAALPRRVAGGRQGYWQLYAQGLRALTAFRQGSDPLAWQRFTRQCKAQEWQPKRLYRKAD